MLLLLSIQIIVFSAAEQQARLFQTQSPTLGAQQGAPSAATPNHESGAVGGADSPSPSGRPTPTGVLKDTSSNSKDFLGPIIRRLRKLCPLKGVICKSECQHLLAVT